MNDLEKFRLEKISNDFTHEYLESAISEIGIDCIDISEFDDDTLTNKHLLKKIFTKNEIQYCNRKAKPSQHFAARFAGKEAVIKALSRYNIEIPFNEIEIVNNDKGLPMVRILKDTSNNFDIKISLSHSREIAMAVALVSKDSK